MEERYSKEGLDELLNKIGEIGKKYSEEESSNQDYSSRRITKQDKIELLRLDNRKGYWEYKVINISDDYSGSVNTNHIEILLNELGLAGWHLKCAYSNEIGKNSSSSGAYGMTSGTNATIDQNILIFERFVHI